VLFQVIGRAGRGQGQEKRWCKVPARTSRAESAIKGDQNAFYQPKLKQRQNGGPAAFRRLAASSFGI